MCIQFNLKPKRGNQLGKYINIGGYGQWIFLNKLSYKFSNVSNAKESKVTHRSLDYIKHLNYGASITLGLKKAACFINYRLSDIFNSPQDTGFIELPRLQLGVQMAVFKNKYG